MRCPCSSAIRLVDASHSFNLIRQMTREGRDVMFGCGAETGNRALQHVAKPLVFQAAAEVIQRNHLFLNHRFIFDN